MDSKDRRETRGAAYYPLRALNRIGSAIGAGSKDRLRALILHDVPESEDARLAAQLEWLSRTWRFVTPGEFGAMMTGGSTVVGSNLLVTFDDGFQSNRRVAERILNPAGIKALFFVVSDLLSISDPAAARRFMADRLGFSLPHDAVPSDWSNLTWADAQALIDQGHTIGAHTATHARLADVTSDDELRREIIDSADVMAARLGVDVQHFAYTYGDLASLSKAAFDVARKRFRFIHSGLRGDNAGASPLAIRRDACAMIDARHNYFLYSNLYTGALLEGAADSRHAADRARLDEWAR